MYVGPPSSPPPPPLPPPASRSVPLGAMPGLPTQQYVWTESTSQPSYVRPAEVQVDPRNVIALLDDDHFYLSRLFRRIPKMTLPHRPLLLFHPECQWAIDSTDRRRFELPFPIYRRRLCRFPFIAWLDRRRGFAGRPVLRLEECPSPPLRLILVVILRTWARQRRDRKKINYYILR